jgi:enoyl-CoA hydratase/carnithine racemase
MTERPVVVEVDGPIMTARLNRPEKLNAINLEMSQILDEAVWRFGDTEELRVLVITGTGRYFCAGLDISDEGQAARREFEGPQPSRHLQRRKYRQRHHELHDELEKIEKPIIHAAQGPCLGLGLEMAASCDFRFCTPQTHYGLPEVEKLGVIAGSGGTSRVTRLVGPAWAKWLGMAGMNVDAETALRIGLVHQVHEADVFMDRVLAFATRLAGLPAEAVALGKLVVDLCTAEDREKTRHIERIANSALGSGAPRERGAL